MPQAEAFLASAMLQTPEKPGKSALDSSWHELSGKKPPRNKRQPSVDEQVRKSLKDNFKSLGPKETDGTVRDGLTLRQRLRVDKERAQKDPKSVQFGRKYYDALRQLYADSERAEMCLKPDDTLAARPELLSAATAAMKHPPNRSLMLAFLQTAQELNRTEVVGIFRWFLKLHPASSSDQLEACKNVLEMVARLKLESKFETECKLVRDKFDEVLLQAWDCVRCFGGKGRQEQVFAGQNCKVTLLGEVLLELVAFRR